MNGSPVNKLAQRPFNAHVSPVKISYLDKPQWRLGGLLIIGLWAVACEGGNAPPGEPELGTVSQATMAADPCADPSSATIVGTPGDDYLLGTSGDDIIFGLGGDDVIVGKEGNDILCGGDGKDQLQGGAGDDVIHGGADYNNLHGNGGDDVIYGGDDGNEQQGGPGEDTLIGGAGNDWLLGGDDSDSLDGGGGDDDMDGGPGDDAIYGGDGDDWMLGGHGNDCLDGGPGDDRIHGEDGDDGLVGGDGVDQLVCGAGTDTHGEGEWDFGSCESAGMCSATVSGGVIDAPGGGEGCYEADCTLYPDDPACCDSDTSVCTTSGVCEKVPGDIEGLIWIDFNGNGVMDPGDVTGAGASVELFEDKAPADGIPDGAAVASTISGGDGSFRFSGLLGAHVVRVDVAMLPPGFCHSIGPHSRIDPLTGYSEPVLVMGANPKHIVSGLDIGMKFVGCP